MTSCPSCEGVIACAPRCRLGTHPKLREAVERHCPACGEIITARKDVFCGRKCRNGSSALSGAMSAAWRKGGHSAVFLGPVAVFR